MRRPRVSRRLSSPTASVLIVSIRSAYPQISPPATRCSRGHLRAKGRLRKRARACVRRGGYFLMFPGVARQRLGARAFLSAMCVRKIPSRRVAFCGQISRAEMPALPGTAFQKRRSRRPHTDVARAAKPADEAKPRTV
jgi:hypothetical protein